MSAEPGDNRDDLLGDIHKLVERWNRKHYATVASAFEAYVDGNIDLLFEYAVRGDSLHYPVIQCERLTVPAEVTSALRYTDGRVSRQAWEEVRDLFTHLPNHNVQVVSHWDQGGVFVRVVDGVHEVEELVASRFTVGFGRLYGGVELWTNLVGESVAAGFLKPCGGFRKWELNGPLLSRAGRIGSHHSGIRVVDCGAQVLNGVPAPEHKSIHDGFVAFGVGGAPSGFGIRLKNIAEGSFFHEHFADVCDVLRGPINLEARRLESII